MKLKRDCTLMNGKNLEYGLVLEGQDRSTIFVSTKVRNDDDKALLEEVVAELTHEPKPDERKKNTPALDRAIRLVCDVFPAGVRRQFVLEDAIANLIVDVREECAKKLIEQSAAFRALAANADTSPIIRNIYKAKAEVLEEAAKK